MDPIFPKIPRKRALADSLGSSSEGSLKKSPKRQRAGSPQRPEVDTLEACGATKLGSAPQLPFEIYGEIFSHLNTEDTATTRSLRSACRTTRDALDGLDAFNKLVQADIVKLYNSATPTLVPGHLADKLHRATNLDLTVLCNPRRRWGSTSSLERIIAILQHAPQLKKVAVRFSDLEVISHIVAPELLLDLRIENNLNHLVIPGEEEAWGLQRLTHLRRLEISRHDESSHTLPVNLIQALCNLHTLRSINLEYDRENDGELQHPLKTLIQGQENLEEFRLDKANCSENHVIFNRAVLSGLIGTTGLRSLEICMLSASNQDLTDLVEIINMNIGLEDISFSQAFNDLSLEDSRYIDTYAACIEAAPNLKRLKLGSIWLVTTCQADRLAAALNRAEKLEELSIWCPNSSERTASILAGLKGDRPLLSLQLKDFSNFSTSEPWLTVLGNIRPIYSLSVNMTGRGGDMGFLTSFNLGRATDWNNSLAGTLPRIRGLRTLYIDTILGHSDLAMFADGCSRSKNLR